MISSTSKSLYRLSSIMPQSSQCPVRGLPLCFDIRFSSSFHILGNLYCVPSPLCFGLVNLCLRNGSTCNPTILVSINFPLLHHILLFALQTNKKFMSRNAENDTCFFAVFTFTITHSIKHSCQLGMGRLILFHMQHV